MTNYADLSFRERRLCEGRDRGISEKDLSQRFNCTPERVRQIEDQARQKLALLPLTEERLEDLIDCAIKKARSSHAPDLAIRADVLRWRRERNDLA